MDASARTQMQVFCRRSKKELSLGSPHMQNCGRISGIAEAMVWGAEAIWSVEVPFFLAPAIAQKQKTLRKYERSAI